MSKQTDVLYGRRGGRIVPWHLTKAAEPPRRATVWDKLAGLQCVCPPDCTDQVWGDGPRDCDPKCKPCQIMRGQPYEKHPMAERNR